MAGGSVSAPPAPSSPHPPPPGTADWHWCLIRCAFFRTKITFLFDVKWDRLLGNLINAKVKFRVHCAIKPRSTVAAIGTRTWRELTIELVLGEGTRFVESTIGLLLSLDHVVIEKVRVKY
jgi:hypothetical protein